MPTKKDLLQKVKGGNLNFLLDLLKLEYEEVKEKLIYQLNDNEYKRLQGEARRLQEIIKLINKPVSF